MTDNVCCSGGAIGADTHWGIEAQAHGHSVIHLSFKGHKADTSSGEIITLTHEQLLQADDHLARANKSLRRKWPVSNYHVACLLRRNYFQVAWSDSLYGVSHFDLNGQVDGGTAWAVQMMIDLHPGAPVYVFDQNLKQWFQWKGRWMPIACPPTPSGAYAGVGSRKLKETGREAISALYEKS